MTAVGLALAALIGLSLGLLGGGGSILTVPVLVYVLGFGAKPAIAMSLAVVGTTSLVGAGGHWRAGNVRVRVALMFGAVAMVGSYLGARASALVSGSTQLIAFAVVMLAAAVFMLRGRRETGSEEGRGEVSIPLLVPLALAVGVLTGLVGVGGGFLIVPALVLVARLPMKQAVGTSLLVIALNAFTAFAGYLGRVELDWWFMAGFTAIAIGGVFAGTALVKRVPAAALRRGFAVFLIGMAGFILYENRGVLLGDPPARASLTTERS